MVGNAADRVRLHLNEVLESPLFVRSIRLAAFLRWVVEKSLADENAAISERSIALEVYQRRKDFDPKLDGTVRAEAIRLRNKLREYYASSPGDGARITIPKGSYVPAFTGFDPVAEDPRSDRRFSLSPARGLSLALGIVFLGALAAPLYQKQVMPSLGRAAVGADGVLASGERLLSTGNTFAALKLFQQAEVERPNDAAVHLGLASAFEALGWDQDFREEASRARELAQSGPRDERLRAEACWRRADGDRRGAVKVAEELLASGNPSVETEEKIADEQILEHDFTGALGSVRKARAMCGGEDNPELDRLEALALGVMGKPAAAIPIVERAVRTSGARQDDAVLGRLIVLKAGLVQNTGNFSEAEALLARGRLYCEQIHDDVCVARTYRVDGNRMIHLARYDEALRDYRKGLTIASSRHNRRDLDELLDGVQAVIDASEAGLMRRPDVPLIH